MSFPDDPRDLKVGFAFGHNDAEDPSGLTFDQVSPDVGDPDDPGPALGTVTTTRGRVGDASTTDTTQIETSLRDDEGQFSPRNVEGEHYGELRNGTPCQVAVDVGAGDQVVATAFVPDWNPTWIGPDMDDRVAVNALGTLARLGRDDRVFSAMRMEIPRDSTLREYWPMEDGDAATVFASAIPGRQSIDANTTSPGSDSSLKASRPLPTFAADSFIHAPLMTSAFVSGEWTATWCVRFPNGTPASQTDLGKITTSTGSAERWVISANSTTLFLDAFNAAGSTVHSESLVSSAVATLFSGEWCRVVLRATAGTWSFTIFPESTPSTGTAITDVDGTVVPGAPSFFNVHADSELDGMAIGHLAVFDFYTVLGAPTALAAYDGTTAAYRAVRVAESLGVPITTDALAPSTPMGPMTPDTVLNLLRDCEAAEHGVLYELRDGRLNLQLRSDRHNQAVALTLDYGTADDPGDVSDLQQFDDNRDLANLVTVTRRDGASAVAELTTGPVGTDDTEGVGPRPLPVTLSLHVDGQVLNHAGWLLYAGTINKPRYVVVLDLYANPGLAAGVMDCDIGSRITISGAPAKHVGPDDLDLIIEGEVMELGADRWTAAWWCEPNLYDIGTYGTGGTFTKRYDTRGSTTTEALDTTETGVETITSTGTPWSTDAVPYDLTVGGEIITCTAVAPNPTYIGVGTTPDADNAAVSPTIHASTAAGDVMLLVARFRNTTATLSPPAGWHPLARFQGLHVWGKVHSGSESSPTVTPSGGSAGDTVQAVVVSYRGVTLASAGRVWQSNSSAQNIAYPAFTPTPTGPAHGGAVVVLLVAGKSDDWTSVSGGLTLVVDATTTTGSDQSLHISRTEQSTPALISSGTLTVTGGASAVSNALLLALPVAAQILTVVRSVNGVVKSHASGAQVRIAPPMNGVYGLGQ